MKRCLAVLVAVLLAGCAAAPVSPPAPETLFDDAAFAAPAERVRPDQVFALSDEMRHYLDQEIGGQVRRRGPREALLDALYTRNQLKLEYDSSMTRSAAQAFDARAGNCLSLVIMTSALAQHLGLAVHYNDVYTDEVWSRSGDLIVSSGHVNVTIGHRIGDERSRFDSGRSTTIDFNPPEPGKRPMQREISETTVTAMYFNNRAAEALVEGRVDEAYWHARAALRQAPTFVPAHNTLAVVYLRHGQPLQAERVLRAMLEREPANTTLLANLVRTLEAQGRQAEAQVLAQRLAKIEPTPPFHYFNLGLAALARSDFRAARDAFQHEIDRAAYYHEFHFGLAMAYFGMGDIESGRRQLAIARENSVTLNQRDLYTAKLEKLKSLRVQ